MLVNGVGLGAYVKIAHAHNQHTHTHTHTHVHTPGASGVQSGWGGHAPKACLHDRSPRPSSPDPHTMQLSLSECTRTQPQNLTHTARHSHAESKLRATFRAIHTVMAMCYIYCNHERVH
jgi:hypothetical protein